MKKSLYSLILTDDVITAVDEIAYGLNISRSSYINELLANHVLYTTSRQVVKELLDETKETLLAYGKFTSIEMSSQSHMSVRSALRYSYNPTVKYCIEIIKLDSGFTGKMRAYVKTQNIALLSEMKEFFTCWHDLEGRNETREDKKMTDLYGFNDLSYNRNFEYGRFEEIADIKSLAQQTALYIHSLNEAFNLFLSSDNKEIIIKKIADIYNRYIQTNKERL